VLAVPLSYRLADDRDLRLCRPNLPGDIDVSVDIQYVRGCFTFL
jgi:hypothetical protein